MSKIRTVAHSAQVINLIAIGNINPRSHDDESMNQCLFCIAGCKMGIAVTVNALLDRPAFIQSSWKDDSFQLLSVRPAVHRTWLARSHGLILQQPLDWDKVENGLNALVCSGKMQLTDAQQRIASNWKTALP